MFLWSLAERVGPMLCSFPLVHKQLLNNKVPGAKTKLMLMELKTLWEAKPMHSDNTEDRAVAVIQGERRKAEEAGLGKIREESGTDTELSLER